MVGEPLSIIVTVVTAEGRKRERCEGTGFKGHLHAELIDMSRFKKKSIP